MSLDMSARRSGPLPGLEVGREERTNEDHGEEKAKKDQAELEPPGCALFAAVGAMTGRVGEPLPQGREDEHADSEHRGAHEEGAVDDHLELVTNVAQHEALKPARHGVHQDTEDATGDDTETDQDATNTSCHEKTSRIRLRINRQDSYRTWTDFSTIKRCQ